MGSPCVVECQVVQAGAEARHSLGSTSVHGWGELSSDATPLMESHGCFARGEGRGGAGGRASPSLQQIMIFYHYHFVTAKMKVKPCLGSTTSELSRQHNSGFLVLLIVHLRNLRLLH